MEVQPEQPSTKGPAEMFTGDTVYTPPGEWHWHGAAPQHFMTHLARWESLGDEQDGPETEWAEHVTHEEYSQPRAEHAVP